MTTALENFLSPEERNALLRLAKGERDTSPSPAPMGIRATTDRTSPPTPPRARPSIAVGNIDHLLSQALRSENGRTRAMAEKIHTLAADLAHRVQTEYQARRQRLDAEVIALEQQLADARARLHQLDRDSTPPTTPTPPATTPAPPWQAGAKSGVNAAAVRAWAVENGYQVQPMGRIPTDVINAWRRATIGS